MATEAVHVRHFAMATEFELLLHGERRDYLEAVAEEAMREIDRVEAQLSFYRMESDVANINARAAYHPVPVDGEVFQLLQRAKSLSDLTQGAFDITVAPLMRCWGFVGASGKMPDPEILQSARERVGMHHLLLNEDSLTVAFDRAGVEIDLGAIGKGYAVDRIVEMLHDYEIGSALFHGGTSTVYALGNPPGEESWKVAIQAPLLDSVDRSDREESGGQLVNLGDGVIVQTFGTPALEPMNDDMGHLALVALRDEALNVSAPHGKWFRSQSDGRRYGHVIDPRTGYPTNSGRLAALVLPSATDGDALSTGLLTAGATWIPTLEAQFPECRGLLVTRGGRTSGQ